VRDGKGEEARNRFSELQELLAAASRVLVGRAAPVASDTQEDTPGLSWAEFHQTLQRLAQCLERGELPDEMVQTVCSTLEKSDPVYAKALKAAIDSFEFSKAQALLQQVIANNSTKMET